MIDLADSLDGLLHLVLPRFGGLQRLASLDLGLFGFGDQFREVPLAYARGSGTGANYQLLTAN